MWAITRLHAKESACCKSTGLQQLGN